MSDTEQPDKPYTGPIPDHIRHIIASAEEVIQDGGHIHFKFTCLSCGARQTFEEPNKLYLIGQCEECGAETDLCHRDANVDFLAVISMSTTGPIPPK